MLDPITTQVALWLGAACLITLLGCLCTVGYHAATAWAERSRANTEIQKLRVREAEALADRAESEYQKALLERVGTVPAVPVNLPQEVLDKLAMDTLKKRFDSMRIKVEL
jgi:hypothetical protein